MNLYLDSLSVGSQNNQAKFKPKSKWLVYKCSRIDKLVSDNITKMKTKEEKATLKKIKEVGDIISKKGELIRLNQKVRLNNAKLYKKSSNRNRETLG